MYIRDRLCLHFYDFSIGVILSTAGFIGGYGLNWCCQIWY